MRSDIDLPYINEVLIAYRARDFAYRAGPAHKVQLVVNAPHPSPQSAIVRTLRPTLPRFNASPNLRIAYGWFESIDMGVFSEGTNQTSSHFEHGEKRYLKRQARVSHEEDCPRNRSLPSADSNDRNSEDTLCKNDNGTDVGPIAARTHRALCAADFEDSDDEDSLRDDGDIGGLDLEANTRWSKNNNKELEIAHEHQLTTMQLRIQEKVLKDIVQQALKARSNGRVDSSFFSEEAPEEEDGVLEMILDLMRLEQEAVQGDEGRDIQILVRNHLHTLLRKATRPFRPSGISVGESELTQCLETFRQIRLKMLQENPGMSMAEILKEKSLVIRPR